MYMQNKKRKPCRRNARGFFLLFAFAVSMMTGCGSFTVGCRNHPGINTVADGIVVEEKGVDSLKQTYVIIHSSGTYHLPEFFQKSQKMRISQDLYEEVQTGTEYWVNIYINIPVSTAKRRGLLERDGMLSAERVLQNEEIMRKYAIIQQIGTHE